MEKLQKSISESSAQSSQPETSSLTSQTQRKVPRVTTLYKKIRKPLRKFKQSNAQPTGSTEASRSGFKRERTEGPSAYVPWEVIIISDDNESEEAKICENH